MNMKRIIIVFLVLSSLTAVSQESVLLRVNYKKGDKYVLKVEQKQDMGLLGGMNMTMTMSMSVNEVKEETFKTESKITRVVIDMMQGGQTMKFDSSMKEEDLDQIGQIMKSQFDPMMKVSILATVSNLGENIETKIEPVIPGTEELGKESNSISYPKEKVSVGSTWSTENENQGIKIKTTYKVVKIEKGAVYLEITGTLSGISNGTLLGKTEIDIKTGVQKSGEIEMTMTDNETTVKSSTKTTITKV